LLSRGEQADAVLLDGVLRDIDGVELLRWIKERSELVDIEVVIQSAELVPEKIRAGIDCGAYYYLTKPYDAAQLQAIVKAAVESARLKRAILKEANDASDVLRLLDHGTFLVRTVQDSQALSARLAAACRDPDKGMALFELLVNAVEHGNLGISYGDKSRLLAQGAHQAEIERRLGLVEYRDRRVSVELRRDADRLQITIQDCGSGFDYQKYLTVDPQRLFDAHGRGIMMAMSLLDVEFVDPGNEVRVSMLLQS
jgi:response regulator RpfG family c-di-GMP phosphodiesterase